MKSGKQKLFIILLSAILFLSGCNLPAPEKKESTLRVKHNYIILLDLSDRLIVQDNQPERDKRLIRSLYTLFEEKVKRELYIKSRDEIKVVIAPQRGTRLKRDVFEDRLYVNMNTINRVNRKLREAERRENFLANLDTLYDQAVFSKIPHQYYGADIWKYFYEDLKMDYSRDTLTENYLFILTDGYPIVGHQHKLLEVKNQFPDLHIVLLEAAPREKDMEWDRVMGIWEEWFYKIGIKKYTLVKRGSITKEEEQIKEIVTGKGNHALGSVSTSFLSLSLEPVASADISLLRDIYKNERRYALIIGNSNYKQVNPLNNPINDAIGFAAVLRRMNFDVTCITDATYIEIRSAFLKFHEKLVNGPKDQTVGLFYYAGHGLQNSGENYLVPVDASIEYEDDISRQCFPVQKIILGNMSLSNSRMNILILDACRNNPFPGTLRTTEGGLIEMKRAKGSFIAYATAPGSTAFDGTGKNGLYTQELMKAIEKPGLSIEQVFKEVRLNVLRLSGEKQNTWDVSNITGEFYFNLNGIEEAPHD
ncbi:MAG TPA: caspase family protein [Cyclobacteriaceae bacterium]|nr:caspase family protein [Cyclobacteriaceae bacterium]